MAIVPLLCACGAFACSMAGCANEGEEMRSTFSILVTHDDKPLAGVNFHIAANGTEQFSGSTTNMGTIRVQKLAPGLYWLSGDFLGTGVVYTCFHVSAKPSRKAKARLSYMWGDEAPATTRIAGKLVDSQPAKGGTPIWNLTHGIDVPIAGANLKLQDPVTHAVYRTSSDQNGEFSFEALPSATYVLHIEGGMAGDRDYHATNAVVSVDSSAPRNWLVFKRSDAGSGSCGGTELELQTN